MRYFLPLRWRLTIWYSSIVLLSLSVFAFSAYYWVFNELYSNLDESLIKISKTLNYIIEESSGESLNRGKQEFLEAINRSTDRFKLFKQEKQLRFIGPSKPGKKEVIENKQDIVWSAIFNHILLNPESYYIQIADTNNQLIWKSKNLEFYHLPIQLKGFSLHNVKRIGKIELGFENIELNNDQLRLLVNKSDNAVITIAYTVKEVRNTLRELFSFLLLSVPVILVVSFVGGMFLSKLSLKPVDRITNTAKEITAKNLRMKMAVPPNNDEISRLIETLNDMIQRLEKSFTQIKQFTSDASHELRTPLTILRGELEIALNKERTQEEYAEILASSLEEVMRMSRIIESLLELSRADAGQTKMQLQEENFSDMLLEICEDMEILAADKEITLKSDIEKDLTFEYDSLRMRQVLLNIIDNSIKYSNPGGKIKLTLTDRMSYVEIRLSDTGIGMKEKELSHIFDRFYRVDKARSADIKGTGLGLSIVKWIIESHNGKIFVESQPLKGTNFTILLPKDGKKIIINND